MLIDFTIKNYRSVKEPVTLSTLATNIKEHSENVFHSEKEQNINLLKTSVIYGANASGKSNIIKALDTFQDFVVESTDLKLGEKIKYYDPFKLEKKYSNEPTMFEIEFIGKKFIRYRYCVNFNRDEILNESLFFFPKGQEALLFLREKGKKIKFGDYYQGSAKTIEKQLLDNNLFLSKAANSNNKLLKDIYLYFRNTLVLSTSAQSFQLENFTTSECLKDESPINKKVISEFLKIADTGIEYMDINKNMFSEYQLHIHDSEDIKKVRIHKPQMYHKVFENGKEVDTIGFDLKDESNGTKKLYDLAGKILHVLNNGLVMIADELNNSLHPFMTQAIIDIFQRPETNPKNAQLIFATHDTTLLNPDMLRRDQIWLTEKDQYGVTSLYSVSEFDYRKVRADIPFDKWYLSGRFGALPVIGRFEEWMEHAQKETKE